LVTLNAVDLLNWVQFDDNPTLDSLLDDFFDEFDVDQNGFLLSPISMPYAHQ
jgi:hypothetical protein